jgi:DNA-binding CsgD family transcriptional regulator
MKLSVGFRKDRMILLFIIVLQAAFSVFYVVDFGLDVFGFRTVPMSWEYYELVQGSTIVGLSLGVVLGVVMLVNLVRRASEISSTMLAAKGAFHELMLVKFDEWGLSPSERDVAGFTIKGMSNDEIAELRGKSVGTIKSQCNAIFRKANVTGRAQLVSLFIEDLTAEPN